MTVAKLQWVIVGVIKTMTVWRGESGTLGRVGLMKISGRETTASSPKDRGCSGSEIDLIKSEILDQERFIRSFLKIEMARVALP